MDGLREIHIDWGRQVATLGQDTTPQAVSRIDDLTEEWRSRLQAHDLVMHRTRFIDRPRAARFRNVFCSDRLHNMQSQEGFAMCETQRCTTISGCPNYLHFK